MAEKVNVAWGVYINPNKTYTATRRVLKDGEWADEEYQEYGVEEPGYRHPDTHVVIFESDSQEDVEAKGTVPEEEPAELVTSQVEIERVPATPVVGQEDDKE